MLIIMSQESGPPSQSSISAILYLLDCPLYRGGLRMTAEGLESKKGSTFPETEGIYWLYRQPQAHWLQWQARARALLAAQDKQTTLLAEERAVLPPDASPLTENRLELLREGRLHNRKVYSEILAPLLKVQEGEGGGPKGDQLQWTASLAESLPSHQNMASYHEVLFRDWAWENGENKAAFDLLQRLWLGKDYGSKSGLPMGDKVVAVLGSGAGRLAVDLHHHFKPKASLLIDINPLLHLAAHRLIRGESFQLYEFPHPPLSHEQVAVAQLCENPYGPQPDMHLLFADVSQLPLKPQSLDVVVTPWLIDIIPEDLPSFIRRVNRVLKQGGLWLNFGPLGFETRSLAQRLCFAEVKELLEQSGFALEVDFQERVPYLQSPHSSHGRVETVFCFRGKKLKEVKEPKRFDYLPSWLRDWAEPIPVTNFTAELALINKVHYEITAIIDGRVSFSEIALAMEQNYGMTRSQAEETLFSILLKVHESSLRI